MRRLSPILLAALFLTPRPSSAIRLHWIAGTSDMAFAEATRCTLVVEADSSEGMLPAEWSLQWVAEGLPNLTVVPDTRFGEGTMAQAVSVLPPTAAEAKANQLTCNFRFPNSPPISAARYILDLPAGSAGNFIVHALLGDATGGHLVRSTSATFNGGVAAEFPPAVMGATGDHKTTKLNVKALGAGLATAASAALVAADTSWRLPLAITSVTDSTLTAEAEVPTQLPDGTLQVSIADTMEAATTLPASQVTAPLLAPVTMDGDSWFVPPDSAGISPKDFAFVYNTVPTATPGVWRGLFHLLYIRHLPNGDELSLSHAWSPDLQHWSYAKYAFGTGPLGSWDALHVWAPSVVQNGNLWYMFYTGVDAAWNQRIGRVTTALLDTTDTVWSVTDRKMVFAADSTSWVARHPADLLGADQFRDPYVFQDPDSAGRFLMVYAALDTNYKSQDGLSVGLARNRPGTLDRWLDRGRYGFTDYGRNGHMAQLEAPLMFPDSGYASPYWITHSRPTGWRLMYTWGGDHPTQKTRTLRVAKDTLAVNVADTSSAGWGATEILGAYLSGDTAVTGWNGSEHAQAQNVDYMAGFYAYDVDGIQIVRMHWVGPNFYLNRPEVTGIDEAASTTADVGLSVPRFDPRARRVRFRIRLPIPLSVRFDVYDVAGRRLRRLVDRRLPPGDTFVEWDRSSAGGAAVPSGVYFARLTYESGSRIAKIPLIR